MIKNKQKFPASMHDAAMKLAKSKGLNPPKNLKPCPPELEGHSAKDALGIMAKGKIPPEIESAARAAWGGGASKKGSSSKSSGSKSSSGKSSSGSSAKSSKGRAKSRRDMEYDDIFSRDADMTYSLYLSRNAEPIYWEETDSIFARDADFDEFDLHFRDVDDADVGMYSREIDPDSFNFYTRAAEAGEDGNDFFLH
jgi:hypothetical protein